MDCLLDILSCQTFQILFVVNILLNVLLIRYALKTVKKVDLVPEEIHAKYYPWRRNDRKKWDKYAMIYYIYGSFVVLPKFLLFFFGTLPLYIICKIFTFGMQTKAPTGFRRTVISFAG